VYISRIPVEDDQRKFKCHYQYNPYIENSVLGLISRLGHLKNGPAVSIQYVTVTDRQTDRQTHHSHASRGKKKSGKSVPSETSSFEARLRQRHGLSRASK